MKRVWHGKAIHAPARQVTVRAVSGKVVISTLCVASVADDCSTLHCSLHQRFDITVVCITRSVVIITANMCYSLRLV